MYLNYTEYKALGGELDEPSFKMLEFASSQDIQSATFGRLADLPAIPDAVRFCCFQLISVNERTTNTLGAESIGNWAKTYKADDTLAKMKDDILLQYLGNIEVDGTPVLYRGAQ